MGGARDGARQHIEGAVTPLPGATAIYLMY